MAAATAREPAPEARQALQHLRERLEGTLIEPGEPGYDAARAVWNGLIDRYPRAIVRAGSVADIAPTLETARETGLRLAVRGGGHNIAGHGTIDDGIVLDLGGLTAVEVDPSTRLVRVAPGARGADVDAATSAHQLAVPLAASSLPGVAGQTLGGGVGWLTRAAGLALDRLVEAQVVTASGEHLVANAEQHPDLFWGLRGGGGNFGVVSSFAFRAVELPAQVLGATFSYRPAQWRRALAAFERWSRQLPDQLAAILTFGVLPAELGRGDAPWLRIRCVHVGSDEEAGARALERLRRAAPPDVEESGPVDWPRWQSATDSQFTAGSRGFWHNVAFSRMDEDALDEILAYAGQLDAPGTSIDIHHLGGVFARVPEAATAFPNRSARFWMSAHAVWQEPAADASHIAFARRAHRAMARLSEEGEYVNFLGPEDSHPIAEFTRHAYGAEKYAQLVRIKQRYDPGNLFRQNHNVRPDG